MDSPNTKIKSRRTVNRKALLLCIVFLVFSQMMSSAQKTASVFTPSTRDKDQRTTVSVDFKKVPLAEALKTLARKVNVGISYETVIVPAKRVTYRAENRSIFKVLDEILKDTGLQSTLSQDRKVIMIKKRPVVTAQKQETIKGTVTDASTGETLPGVNIAVKGTTTGTSTGANGQYELTVESLQDTLVFSYVGYQSQTVFINGRKRLDVALNSSTQSLDEMVVVGFGGEQSRRDVVGSVSSVKMESVEAVEASTFNQKLAGKISGVNVKTASGRLGSGVKINIRGTTSINASSQPLYVIDGVPVVNKSLGQGGGVYGSNARINPFINLDSDNIKSIDVLKDAASAAIYGTRGSNGVVLITTKNGSEQRQTFNINVSGGFSHPTNELDVLNGPEYIDVYNYKNGTNYDASDYANTD